MMNVLVGTLALLTALTGSVGINPSTSRRSGIAALSPDGRNEIRLYEEPLAYEVLRDGKPVVARSVISLRINGRELARRAANPPKITQADVTGVQPTPFYKKSKIALSGNETLVDWGDWAIRLSARDDGVAYRFETRMEGKVRVDDERADVCIPDASARTWVNFTDRYACEESVAVPTSVGETFTDGEAHKMIYLPFVYRTAGTTVAVTESDVCDYPIWNLKRLSGGAPTDPFVSDFARWPLFSFRCMDGEEWTDLVACAQGGRWVRVSERTDYLVKTDGNRTFPWRVFILADSPAKLCEADIVFALARPSAAGSDFSWVRPGKVAWDWWNGFDNKGRLKGCTTKTYERFIDFAAKNGVEYVILDEGWSEKLDIWKYNPKVDVPHLIGYAAKRNVGIILWMAWAQIVGEEARIAEHFGKLGAKGFKVDFMDRGDAEAERFLWTFADECAKRHLLVDYHGAHRPTGMERAYPNVLNFEGVHGLEGMKWFKNEYDFMASDLASYYTRMTAGPADYTPGAMDNYPPGKYKGSSVNAGSVGTRSRQMAMMAAFFAPLQMLCDSPTKYEKNMECFRFMAETPVVWDETRGLGGDPDSFVLVARRKGEVWYVAGLSNADARTVSVDLSFLGSGRWIAEIFRDAPDGVERPSSYVHETISVLGGDHCDLHMAPGGGFAMRLTKEKPVFVVAEDGRVRADIVLSAKPLPVERYAAEELKHHLDKATGLRYEIVNEGSFDPSACPYHFYIGATKAASAKGLPGRALKPDERFLRTEGNGLYLLGRDGDSSLESILQTWTVNFVGTLYAVYDFLEAELGVIWIWPGETGEVVPKRTSLAFGRIDRGGIEPLEERWWYSTDTRGDKMGFTSMEALEHFYREQSRFLVRHRVGRRVDMKVSHAFGDWWERFGKTHPEYFNLLSDGQRRPFGKPSLVTLCCSEPGVWKQRAADWKEWWEKEGKCSGQEPLVCCCENDSAGLCRCANCRAWDAPDPRFDLHPYWNGSLTHEDLETIRKTDGPWGLSWLVGDNRWDIQKVDPATRPTASLSDRYANFYNHVQAEVAKVNPAARVVGYAYENYVEAPKRTRLDPRVVIEYVPRCYFPYDQAESDFFRTNLLGWRAAGMGAFSYRPNYMLAGGNYPFDQGRIILEDFAFAYTNGMKACTFDSLRGSWSAHALMDYALIRAFRDPTHGYGRARRELLSAFGPAAEAVGRYLDAVREHTESWTEPEVRRIALANIANGRRGGSFGNPAGFLGEFFDETFFVRNNAILDEAIRQADGDSEVLARVEFLRKGLRDAELTRRVRLAQKALDADKGNAAKQEAFDAAFKTMNDFRASVENDLVCNFKHEAMRERKALSWPHKLLEDK